METSGGQNTDHGNTPATAEATDPNDVATARESAPFGSTMECQTSEPATESTKSAKCKLLEQSKMAGKTKSRSKNKLDSIMEGYNYTQDITPAALPQALGKQKIKYSTAVTSNTFKSLKVGGLQTWHRLNIYRISKVKNKNYTYVIYYLQISIVL